jgi:Arc/MetJ family transcription regulator
VVAKTLIDIPDELMAEARAIVGPDSTKAETVRRALTEMIRRHRQREAVEWLASTDALGDLNDPEVRAAARR